MQNLAKTHKALQLLMTNMVVQPGPVLLQSLWLIWLKTVRNMVITTFQMMQQKIQLGMTAVRVLKDMDVEVKPVDSSQFPAKAKRP